MDKISLLLVDDDEVDRMMMRKALINFVAAIDEATSYSECLKMINKKQYDLIILDQKLPDGLGIDIAKQLINNGIMIPIILATGFGSDILEKESIDVGILGYITKDKVTPEIITKTILKAFSQYNNKIQIAIEKNDKIAERLDYVNNLLKIDIAERKERELKLFLDNAMFHAIFDSISDGVIVANSSGEFLFHNRAALNIIGLSFLEKTNPKDFQKYFHFYKSDRETPWPIGQDPLARAIQGKTTVGEIIYIKNDQTKKDAITGVDTFISCMAVPLNYGINPLIAGGLMMFRKIQQISGGFC